MIKIYHTNNTLNKNDFRMDDNDNNLEHSFIHSADAPK
jgi:hypothetical protein